MVQEDPYDGNRKLTPTDCPLILMPPSKNQQINNNKVVKARIIKDKYMPLIPAFRRQKQVDLRL